MTKHLKHYTTTIILTIILLTALCSCSRKSANYIIGVSQCSEDSWRTKLQDELQMATFFNEGVELRFASANDDNKQQEQQIDSLVKTGIDLLIVSPNQVDALSGAIDRAFEKGIPVILYDRKTDSSKFTAFMGADNYLIGQLLGNYVAGQLNGQGNIIEIAGLQSSSPAIERQKGFHEAIALHPGMHIIAQRNGDWKQPSGEKAMHAILDSMKTTGGVPQIDCIFGGNDRMAVGAKTVYDSFASVNGRQNKPLVVGVDALPNAGAGIEQVRDGILTASALYPTHGDELMQLALNILNGKQYAKETMMQSSIVTIDNAKVLLLQHEEVKRQGEYLRKMHQRVDTILTELGTERVFMIFILIVTTIICALLVLSVRATRAKHALNKRLEKEKENLEHEKETVERQRDELEEQRDKLIEVTMHTKGDTTETGSDALDGNEQTFRVENEFMQKFQQCVEKHLNDPDLSVEDLGSDMCLSRVQLYRKVKAMTGKSPVEIIRETRLLRAHQLLADSSLTISEIAYRVGFSSPSYFTKCYRDFFGKAPTEVHRSSTVRQA